MSCECCGGHHCEPDRYPTSLPDMWTCPECGMRYEAHAISDDLAARYRIPTGALGWTSSRD